MRLSREEFEKTNYKMSYDEYYKCYCPDCKKKNDCKHAYTFRRFPRVDGGLGLCLNLKEESSNEKI